MTPPLALLQTSANDPDWSNTRNSQYVQQIVQAQRHGNTCLPTRLGLTEQDYAALLHTYAATLNPFMIEPSPTAVECSALRQQLLDLRRDEWQDLVDLLLSHRLQQDESEIWLAHIVAAACMGSEHLWRDLGMQTREQLRQLLTDNFPELVRRNDKDMRWKKFFYKQLCEQEGGYVCRSPTCEQCPTYHDCFGDES